jgi:hypothetical protein
MSVASRTDNLRRMKRVFPWCPTYREPHRAELTPAQRWSTRRTRVFATDITTVEPQRHANNGRPAGTARVPGTKHLLYAEPMCRRSALAAFAAALLARLDYAHALWPEWKTNRISNFGDGVTPLPLGTNNIVWLGLFCGMQAACRK